MSKWKLIRFSADSPKVHVAESTREGQLSVCGGPRKATPVEAGTVKVGELEQVTCGICTTRLSKRFQDTGSWAFTPPAPKPAKAAAADKAKAVQPDPTAAA